MLALIIAITATIVLTPEVLAQEPHDTVLSSIVLTRTGERTPASYYTKDTIKLSSLGANQAHAQGQFFRSRYLKSSLSSDGNDRAPIYSIDLDQINTDDLTVYTLDQQWNVATAQAFVQGLYPPVSPQTPNSSAPTLDPTGFLANGSYIDAPLAGYQYPLIHVATGSDPGYLYLSANLDCPAFDEAANEYMSSIEFLTTQNSTADMYSTLGSAVLGSTFDHSHMSYRYASPFFDFLNYQNVHNQSAARELAKHRDIETNTSSLTSLQWLADQQEYARLGNLTSKPDLPHGVKGSISTIAGNMLAAFVTDQFSLALIKGQISNLAKPPRLTLLFTDYFPFVSFSALAGLAEHDKAFTGLPQFSASMVFELFTHANLTGPNRFPTSSADLWVRFSFRNGTDPDVPLQSFPLFQNSSSSSSDSSDSTTNEIPWQTFLSHMQSLALDDIADWCTVCNSSEIFCAAGHASDNATLTRSSPSHSRMSPVTAGVIGAMVPLGIALVLLCVMSTCAGFRVHRVPRRGKPAGPLGGFKGDGKMAADPDLSFSPASKGGAVVMGKTGEGEGRGGPMSAEGQERVGSWEMKVVEAGGYRVSTRNFGEESVWGSELELSAEPVKPVERV